MSVSIRRVSQDYGGRILICTGMRTRFQVQESAALKNCSQILFFSHRLIPSLSCTGELEPELVDDLIEKSRLEAETVRKWGAESTAVVLENCIRELVSFIELAKLEAVTLEDAARESGYSYSWIQKKVASGELENVGDKGRPRIRRGDLPWKLKTPSGFADAVLLRRNH
jgi:hypothetical protein